MLVFHLIYALLVVFVSYRYIAYDLLSSLDCGSLYCVCHTPIFYDEHKYGRIETQIQLMLVVWQRLVCHFLMPVPQESKVHISPSHTINIAVFQHFHALFAIKNFNIHSFRDTNVRS